MRFGIGFLPVNCCHVLDWTTGPEYLAGREILRFCPMNGIPLRFKARLQSAGVLNSMKLNF